MVNKDFEKQKKNAQAELARARDNVVELLKQRPSSNFFVRVGIRIRNFFRNLPYFSFNVFKSPLELALNELEDAERKLNQAKTEKKANSGFLNNLFSSSKQAIKQAFQPSEETTKILANTMERYIDTTMYAAPVDLTKALKEYINLMTLHKQEPSSNKTAAETTWGSVRAAIDKGDLINMVELENFLFKIKLLYPDTTAYDEVYESNIPTTFVSSFSSMMEWIAPEKPSSKSHNKVEESKPTSKILAPVRDEIMDRISILLGKPKGTTLAQLGNALNALYQEILKDKPNPAQVDIRDRQITRCLSKDKSVTIADKLLVSTLRDDIYAIKKDLRHQSETSVSKKR